MKITKYEHSGLALEKDGQILLCDPVEFTEKLPDFTNVVAIILTHNHSDHLQPAILERILSTNPGVIIFTTSDTATRLADLNAKVQVVTAGEKLTARNFSLEFFGQNHASIIEGKIPCENIGVMIDDKIVNPGDSFDLPANHSDIKVLFAPIVAPWCKLSESLNYIKTSHSEIVIPVHDGLLSDFGHNVFNNWGKATCNDLGITYLETAQDLEI